MKAGVLIIGSNDTIYHELYRNLKNTNVDVFCARSLLDTRFWDKQIILVILDVNISKADNHQLLQMLRNERPVPVLILSDCENTAERLDVFRAGASAYIGMPYTLDECLAQALALIRLYEDLSQCCNQGDELVFHDGLCINHDKRMVTFRGLPINLTRKEFDILFCLASHPEQVLSREQLYSYVWDTETSFNVEEVVKSHIKTLRRKLSVCGNEYIENVWGVGYRFSQKGR